MIKKLNPKRSLCEQPRDNHGFKRKIQKRKIVSWTRYRADMLGERCGASSEMCADECYDNYEHKNYKKVEATKITIKAHK